jgi:histone demethylase JARID1
MGTELVRTCLKEENMDIPPGFESITKTTFTLKRVKDNEITAASSSSSYSVNASGLHSSPAKMEVDSDFGEESNMKRSLRHRPWINYGQYDNSSGDECDTDQNRPVRTLPKGVVRGCDDCGHCQKVTAGWHPEQARRPEVQDAPVFYPTEEEFEDTLNYIASIRPKAEASGICRIVPPPSWKPPCPLKDKTIWETSKFNTRIQRVDKLQNRNSMSKILKFNDHKRKKRRKSMKTEENHVPADILINSDEAVIPEPCFGFEPGPEFTLDAFQRYANDFKAQYFRKNESSADSGSFRDYWEPSLETIEGEYWRMVEKPSDEIEVLYGADLETGVFGSGFPKSNEQVNCTSDEKYVKSGWNLNNFPRLPGSVLTYESSDISGVLVPWLYIGMCFSSFCWHVEDHHLYSMNYMHWGAPKMWYGVPGKDALKLEAAMRKHLPDLFEEQPDLLHKLVTQLSPSILKAEGVPVFRCVQNAGEFVITFPRAYHAGFNCGFNCAEAVNVAPVDWLPHGQNAIELYREQHRKTSISHDKLLLGAAREAVKAHWELNLLRKNTADNLRWKLVCGRDGILSKALKERSEMERVRREFLCNSTQALKMESGFDATNERECSICLFDLHLSAAGCHYCSPDKYACLNHAKQLCSCSWGAKFFLFRYDVTELSILVEALEGKLSAIYRWARLDLGLALSSYVSKEIPVPPVGKLSYSLEESIKKEDVKTSPSPISNNYSSHEAEVQTYTQCKKEEFSDLSPDPDPVHKVTTLCQLSKEDTFFNNDFVAADKPETEKPSLLSNDSVIVLSDDETEEPNLQVPESAKDTVTIDGVSGDCIKDATTKVEDYNMKTETPAGVHMENIDNNIAEVVSCMQESGDCNVTASEKPEVNLRVTDITQTVTIPGSMSSSQNNNNLDRYYRQKGPRIAKMVRRINCHVEVLQFGVIHSGKLWCDSRAIYPRGFKSRVRYINILDPTNMCYYVSEIVDAGRDGPLFMVSLEHCPSEVFAHVSARRCWEMVRERANQEISKQHKLGRLKLPPLQPPGSLDGMEMFGFSSPTIVQDIQAMDRHRICGEYWQSRPLMQIPELHPDGNKVAAAVESCSDGVDTIITGLLKKANPEELHALYTILTGNSNSNTGSSDHHSLVTRLLNEEIHNRPR